MNKRIREVRKTLRLSQQVFAQKIGLKQNAVSYLEKAGSTVTEQNIKAICAQFHVNEAWLRTGNGPMFTRADERWAAFSQIYEELSPELQDYLMESAKRLLDLQNKQVLPGPHSGLELIREEE